MQAISRSEPSPRGGGTFRATSRHRAAGRAGGTSGIVEPSRNRDTESRRRGIVDDHAEDVRLQVVASLHQLRDAKTSCRLTSEPPWKNMGTPWARQSTPQAAGGDGALNGTQRDPRRSPPIPMSAEPASLMTFDIVKVDVDEARGGDQLDALDARAGPDQRRMHRARRWKTSESPGDGRSE